MPLNFPNSPSLNDFFVAGGRRWQWNGTAWQRIPDPGAQGVQGHQGNTGPTGAQGHQGATAAAGAQGAQGSAGSNGTNGAQGAQGAQGVNGNFGGASFEYTYLTNTTDSDPGAGSLKFNNANLTSATILYIDDTDGGSSNTDIQPFLRTIDDSTSTIKGHVKVSTKTNPDEFVLYTIASLTEATGYFKVTVAYVSGSVTSFTNSSDVSITFARTGDAGSTGAQGNQGYQGAVGAQGAQGQAGASAGLDISTGAPSSPSTGDLWWDSDDGDLHVYYNDGDSSQWVAINVGPMGAQGAQGAQGHQGQTGSGAQGAQGTAGAQGAQGHQGSGGSTGAQGDDANLAMSTGAPSSPDAGDLWFDTDSGILSAYYNDGNSSQWVEVSTGPKGDTGAQGAQGNAGAQGAQGHQGHQGAGGSGGAQGAQGHQGHQGHQGNQGQTGSGGTAGAQGNQGHQGAGGSNGTNGAQGAQGHQGHQGAGGSAGAQGTQGHQGYQGAGGSNGTNGAQGAQGYQGAANATTIQNNGSSRIITGSSSANTLNANDRFLYDGTTLTIYKSVSGDTNPLDQSTPSSNNGIQIKNSSGTNGGFSALTVTAKDVNGTDQSGSFIAQSTSGGYLPEVLITQRSASSGQAKVLQGASSGSCKLFFQGGEKLSTKTDGVAIYNELSVGTASVQSAGVASFVGGQYNQVNIADGSNSGWGLLLAQQQGTNISTYYTYSTNSSVNRPCSVVNVNNDALHFGTNNTARFRIEHDGHVIPSANNSYDLGSSNYKWRNIFTNDLNLSNEGSKNSVDGTWGNYTIQEGESDLFLINNRNGKKYKFNLTEVS